MAVELDERTVERLGSLRVDGEIVTELISIDEAEQTTLFKSE